ncbi:sulfatase [Halococcus morrhuae]|uniref:sulfatase n=1 Tax=Halococcus morrhuae TaxID=2250 RepID=UPI0006780612|nr:sulfatase [Halococcus morrhuae]
MNVLYIDCDSLRADHLGCYGYDRDTSPTIDALAERGRRFENHYASDTPCLPSRTALFTGRFGFHTGVMNHGGLNADPRPIGSRRDFRGLGDFHTWPEAMDRAGYDTALISPFPSRHGAYHVLDGFNEWIDTGENGRETAEEVSAAATAWLDDTGGDDWYLHLNFWDPHTPYRTPLSYGNPFADEPAPEWLTDETIAAHRDLPGPFSARDLHFYWSGVGPEESPAVKDRMPDEIRDREDFGHLVDGYDTGIRYMDDHIGALLDVLDERDALAETLIVVTADHGESLGERNVYADHATADELTVNLPLIIAGPGVEPGVDTELRYHLDLPPTVVEFIGGEPGPRWDGTSFADALTGTDATAGGRTHVVTSTAAWAVERTVRWDNYLLVRTFHDAYKDLPPTQLFDVESDPHLTTDLAEAKPGVVDRGIRHLDTWKSERLMDTARDRAGGNPDAPRSPADPLWEVLTGDGPFHPDGLDEYLDRLRATGRSDHAETLEGTKGFVTQNWPANDR